MGQCAPVHHHHMGRRAVTDATLSWSAGEIQALWAQPGVNFNNLIPTFFDKVAPRPFPVARIIANKVRNDLPIDTKDTRSRCTYAVSYVSILL